MQAGISLVARPVFCSVTRRKVTVRVTENGTGLGTRLGWDDKQVTFFYMA